MHESDTDLANTALSTVLGRKRIADIDTAVYPNNLVKSALGKAGRVLLGHGLWKTLSVIDVLANVDNDRTNEWTYKHVIPTDSAHLGGVLDQTGSYVWVWSETLRHLLVPIPMELVGGHIYSDTLALSVRYVRRRTDYTKWGDPIQEALAWQLAARVVMPITEDEKFSRYISAGAAEMLDEAFAWDQAQELEEVTPLAGMHGARLL